MALKNIDIKLQHIQKNCLIFDAAWIHKQNNEVNLKIPNILGVLNPLTKVNLEKTRQKAKSNVYDIIRMNAL